MFSGNLNLFDNDPFDHQTFFQPFQHLFSRHMRHMNKIFSQDIFSSFDKSIDHQKNKYVLKIYI